MVKNSHTTVEECRKRHIGGDCSRNSELEVHKFVNIPGLLPATEEPEDRLTNMKLCLLFIKTQYKTIFSYFFLTIILTSVLVKYESSFYYKIPKDWAVSSWSNLLTRITDFKKSDSTYLQAHSPEIYEEIMKQLRQIQQAATYLQEKQQMMEDQTTALQYQLRRLTLYSFKAGALNEVKARNLIREALAIYDADKLGLRDYALESAGGCIISTPETIPYLSEKQYTIFGFISFRQPSNPRLLIQPDNQPGRCFAFRGSTGRVRIRLSNEIHVTAVTLEHTPISLLTEDDIRSAPKDFEVMGLSEENADNGISLGHFSYSIDGTPIQTFLISKTGGMYPVQFVELYVTSNYGHKDYTCIYRLRIHGSRVLH